MNKPYEPYGAHDGRFRHRRPDGWGTGGSWTWHEEREAAVVPPAVLYDAKATAALDAGPATFANHLASSPHEHARVPQPLVRNHDRPTVGRRPKAKDRNG